MSVATISPPGMALGRGPLGAETPQHQAHREPGASADASAAPRVVLIAEDEEPIAEALSLIVEDAGYTPVVASHGKEALEFARAHRPALVLTDLMMPHMSGAQLIAALRADAATLGTFAPPVVLITAAGSRYAKEAGADAVLHKPFNIEDVEQMLSRYLGTPPTA